MEIDENAILSVMVGTLKTGVIVLLQWLEAKVGLILVTQSPM